MAALRHRIVTSLRDAQENFEQLLGLLPTPPSSGEQSATGDLTPLTTSFQDVPGAELALTSSVDSVGVVTASFDLEGVADANSGIFLPRGTLQVDGTDEGDDASWQLHAPTGQNHPNGVMQRIVVTQTYHAELAAGEHTLKLRARKDALAGTAPHHCRAAGTRLSYVLIPVAS